MEIFLYAGKESVINQTTHRKDHGWLKHIDHDMQAWPSLASLALLSHLQDALTVVRLAADEITLWLPY